MIDKPEKPDNTMIWLALGILIYCICDESSRTRIRLEILESKSGIVTPDGKE